jgi:hypothetical protein
MAAQAALNALLVPPIPRKAGAIFRMSKIGKGHADIVGCLVTGEPTKGRISIAKPAIMANQGHGEAGLLDDTAKQCHIARKNDRIKAIGAQPGVYLHLADLTCASEIISI